MKIAMVFDGLGFGGIEKVGLNYVKVLLEQGNEIEIYNLRPENMQMEKEFPKECKIYRKAFPDIVVPERYMFAVKRWPWFRYLYPFVYFSSKVGMYLFRLVGWKRKKYDLVIAFAGHMRDLTFVSYNFIKGEKKVAWLHGALMEYLALCNTFGDFYRKIKNICVLSEDRQVSALEANAYLKCLNISHLYNPISLEQKPIDEKLCKQLNEKYGKYLLMVGRFEEDKDQINVINAYKILKEKYNINPKLLFVGDGSTLEKCKEYTKSLSLQDDVVFLGARYDVQNFYKTALISLHSSPAEGLPTVLLESMKYGVPIVATDSPPGVTEILKNDKFGLKCEVRNPQEMAEKIYKMYSDEELRNYYINQGKERIKDFSDIVIGEKLKKIIENLQ